MEMWQSRSDHVESIEALIKFRAKESNANVKFR